MSLTRSALVVLAGMGLVILLVPVAIGLGMLVLAAAPAGAQDAPERGSRTRDPAEATDWDR